MPSPPPPQPPQPTAGARPPETPPAARRAAMRERVGWEVSNFIDALERVAGGLPEVPGGAAMLAEDAGLGGGGGGGGRGGRSAPALEQVVKDLPRVQVCCQNRYIPYHTTCELSTYDRFTVDARITYL